MARACLRARLARLSPGRPPAALTMLFGASASRVRAVCEPRAGRVRAVYGHDDEEVRTSPDFQECADG